MKKILGLFLILGAVTASAADVYTCEAADKALFGDVKITVNSAMKPIAVEDIDKMQTEINASVEVYQTLDKATKTYEAACVVREDGSPDSACFLFDKGETDPKQKYLFALFALQLESLEGALMQGPGDEPKMYACKKAPAVIKK